jgi:hypothetical protein
MKMVLGIIAIALFISLVIPAIVLETNPRYGDASSELENALAEKELASNENVYAGIPKQDPNGKVTKPVPLGQEKIVTTSGSLHSGSLSEDSGYPASTHTADWTSIDRVIQQSRISSPEPVERPTPEHYYPNMDPEEKARIDAMMDDIDEMLKNPITGSSSGISSGYPPSGLSLSPDSEIMKAIQSASGLNSPGQTDMLSGPSFIPSSAFSPTTIPSSAFSPTTIPSSAFSPSVIPYSEISSAVAAADQQ